MKAPPGRARTSGTAKPKAKSTSGAKKSRKSVAKSASAAKAGATEKSAAQLIDQRIRDLGGWRGETLARMRALILEADPEMAEEWKWDTPVWSHHGIVCTGEAYKQVVKLTFAKGAGLPDPSRLFNSSMQGNTRRAIDIREGEKVDLGAFKALVKAAVAENRSREENTSRASKPRKSAIRSTSPTKAGAKAKSGASEGKAMKARDGAKGRVVLLSGGNPQIAKAEGDAPVEAYIDAIPDWRRDVAKRLDALVVRTVPNVRKAAKWNSPFYGVEGQGWFLSFHVFARYVKVTFFQGTSLRPVPPGGTGKDARWIDVHEDDLDETQMTTWMKQAAALPGWSGRPS
ncbi:MAG TPA: DUF1801 domain-containing protein [Gemmatimonadaceae bacterium]|nr:DUF1801 domain-containing protein [Gemmatimonadaceae bacterium]